jgi:Fic family protein
MAWNWQHPDWPRFAWSPARLAKAEDRFLVGGGVLLGVLSHLDEDSRVRVVVDSLSDEAMTTSEIEGEILDRASVQSSIQRQLGLATDAGRASPAERGVAEMMVDLHRRPTAPLDQATLLAWHRMIMSGRTDLRVIGGYRTHPEPMQVVSGAMYDPKVHFEAPPSSRVPAEMDAFLDWFARTGVGGADALPALTRAGLAHIWFESIHPFEDGNGRIGRAISEKALSQGLEAPALVALAPTILARRRTYYDMLEASNKGVEIEEWLAWFAGIALESQQRARAKVEFAIDKAKLLNRVRDDLNERQTKVLLRVLREGPGGFRGGLSAGNYVSIARTSPATARRDLSDLVAKDVLRRTGERRHARYHPAIPARPVGEVTIDPDGNVVSEAG